eukprot:1156215-Pelagomonas_calceolata.AAC.4
MPQTDTLRLQLKTAMVRLEKSMKEACKKPEEDKVRRPLRWGFQGLMELRSSSLSTRRKGGEGKGLRRKFQVIMQPVKEKEAFCQMHALMVV